MERTSNTPIIISTITVSAEAEQNKPLKKPVKPTPNKLRQLKVQKKPNQTRPPKINPQSITQKLTVPPPKDSSSMKTGSDDSPTKETVSSNVTPIDLVPSVHISAQISHTNMDSIQSTYIQQIARKINLNRYYPAPAKRLKQQGTVVISFSLNKQGVITHSSIKSPSSFPLLNDAALKTLVKCNNFDPIPQTLALNVLDLEIPLEYNLTQ
ncbi:MAG: TonB family protein [Reichenbachiella sp.]